MTSWLLLFLGLGHEFDSFFLDLLSRPDDDDINDAQAKAHKNLWAGGNKNGDQVSVAYVGVLCRHVLLDDRSYPACNFVVNRNEVTLVS